MEQFNSLYPPTVAGVEPLHQLLSYSISGAAASCPWVTDLSTAMDGIGWIYVTVEAKGADAFIRFSTTNSTGTTVNNGVLIKQDQPGTSFYVHPVKHKFVDVIGSAAGTFRIFVSSTPAHRLAQ